MTTESPTPTGTDLLTALEHIIRGGTAQRTNWQNTHIALQDDLLKININNQWHEWIISRTDLEATDWIAQ